MPIPEKPEGVQTRSWEIATAHLSPSDPIPTKITVKPKKAKPINKTCECTDCDCVCEDCECEGCSCPDCD